MPEKIHLRNNLLCVEWDVKLYLLTHSISNSIYGARFRLNTNKLLHFFLFDRSLCLLSSSNSPAVVSGVSSVVERRSLTGELSPDGT